MDGPRGGHVEAWELPRSIRNANSILTICLRGEVLGTTGMVRLEKAPGSGKSFVELRGMPRVYDASAAKMKFNPPGQRAASQTRNAYSFLVSLHVFLTWPEHLRLI